MSENVGFAGQIGPEHVGQVGLCCTNLAYKVYSVL
ncbi:Uncharacterised protein [Acinetobacter baumannii]|nr:Uncharacterised protein [Acinetobacter baumannii]SSR10656.1 Uncharacterised protein [Acinetobacter baumannii]